MVETVSRADIRQMFDRCIVMYKKKPVFIDGVGDDGNIHYIDMYSQRGEFAPFSLETFTSPMRRLGFVNIRGSVVFATRVPVRRFKVGISTDNTKIDTIAVHYPSGKGETREWVRRLCLPEVADTLFNVYPSFGEAVAAVRKQKGAVAFDKQFAISSDNLIFYKTTAVGTIHPKKDTTSDIEFAEGYKHLSLLLDGNHEKTVPSIEA